MKQIKKIPWTERKAIMRTLKRQSKKDKEAVDTLLKLYDKIKPLSSQ